jgi:uncharacterized membrane protein YagU involved in acid resistance
MTATSTRTWIARAVPLGLIAGLTFAAFEMVVAAAQQGAQGFFMPLRMIGAMVLGAQALEPFYSLGYAAIVGLLVHATLSVLFALLFVAVFQPIPTIRPRGLVLTGCLYGVLLWLVNFYVIAPVMGWTWFAERTNPVVQFIAHTFFFGCTLSYLLLRDAAAVHQFD